MGEFDCDFAGPRTRTRAEVRQQNALMSMT